MKGGKSQTVKQELDPATQAMQQQVYGAGLGVFNQPYTPYGGQTVAGASDLSTSAAGQVAGLGGLAGLGGAAMGGDPTAFAQFMNPYTSNVINQVGGQFDRLRSQASIGANDAATRAGAFGGSRHGVMQGQRLGELDRAQGDITAQLHQQGFNDAQGRAFQAANFGLGALGQQFGMGDYFRNIQQQQLGDQYGRFQEARDYPQQQLMMLQGLLSGTPHGSQQTTPLNRNAGAGLLGGAAQGAQIGSMIPGLGTGLGAGIGAGLGLLF